MEQIAKAALIDQIEKGSVNLYLGTFQLKEENRAFYRSYKGAANEPTGYKIVYVVV